MRIILNAKITLLFLLFLTTLTSVSYAMVSEAQSTENLPGWVNDNYIVKYNKECVAQREPTTDIERPQLVLKHATMSKEKIHKLINVETLEIWTGAINDLYMVHNQGEKALISHWILSFKKRIGAIKDKNIPLVIIDPKFFHDYPIHFLDLSGDATEHVDEYNKLLDKLLLSLEQELGSLGNVFVFSMTEDEIIAHILALSQAKSIYIDNRIEFIEDPNAKLQIPSNIQMIFSDWDANKKNFVMKIYQVFNPGEACFIKKHADAAYTYKYQLELAKQFITGFQTYLNENSAPFKTETGQLSVSKSKSGLQQVMKPFIETWRNQHPLLKDNYPETLEELEKIEKSIVEGHNSQPQMASASA